MQQMRLVKDYRDNDKLRESLNDLTEATFQFDFKGWYNSGYWRDKYIPYSIVCDDKVIAKCASVFDAVYNPLETQLIKKAKANGSNAVGGMSMLVWQAVVAHEKWDNSKYDVRDIEKICIDASKELENR